MSIADTLHDAVNEIDTYLHDGSGYDDNTEERIHNVRDSMELLRCRLDTDLEGNEPPFRVYGVPVAEERAEV